MIVVPVREEDNIERALRRYRENLTAQEECVNCVADKLLLNLLS